MDVFRLYRAVSKNAILAWDGSWYTQLPGFTRRGKMVDDGVGCCACAIDDIPEAGYNRVNYSDKVESVGAKDINHDILVHEEESLKWFGI